jgi:hypothetical protein
MGKAIVSFIKRILESSLRQRGITSKYLKRIRKLKRQMRLEAQA